MGKKAKVFRDQEEFMDERQEPAGQYEDSVGGN